MKVHVLLFASSVLMISLFSCTSTRPIMDDNVYVMQTPDLPLGKDLLDETSYDTYKYRVNAGAQTNGYYDQSNRTLINSAPVFTLGSNWFAYGRWDNYGTLPYMSSPYWGAHPNGFYAMEGIPGMGYSNYGYYGSTFAYCYPGYHNAWNNPYYYSPFGGFYNNGMPSNHFYTNGYYGFTGNLNNQNGNNGQYVTGGNGYYVSGPRATSGGYYSGSSRGGTQQIKAPSSVVNNSNSQRNAGYSARSSSNSKPSYSRTATTPARTVGASRTNTQRQSSSTSTARSTSPNRSGGTFRTTSSPTRSSSPSSSGSRSTGTSRSSGSSSSGSSSSGRSGGRGM